MDNQQQNEGRQNDPGVIQPQWQYQSGQLEQQQYSNSTLSHSQNIDSSDGIVKWSASEFVSHEKSGVWYAALIFITIITCVIVFLFTRSIYSVVVVAVLSVALGVFGALKPRTLDYAIDNGGIAVGKQYFEYNLFKSFAVIDDTAVPSIQLIPQKRFMVPITIYFSLADAEVIVETLGQFLPYEYKKRDLVDKISSRIRF